MSTTKTARLMAQLAEAEVTLQAARKTETRAASAAARAAARVTAARTAASGARRELRTATRTGQGLATATRRADRADAKLATLTAAAQDAKTTAAEARRAARTADRRVDSLALRAARAASRTVGRIAERLGRTELAPAPAADKTLPADQLPTLAEIEARADEFATLDAKAKAAAKKADAVKKWLRQIPVGVFGRVTVTRTAGGSVIDGDQIAIDYLDAGLGVPPRKARRDTFKVAVTAAPATELVAVAA